MNKRHQSKVHMMNTDRDPMNLGSLPPLDPPTDGWPTVEAALKDHFGRRRKWKVAASSLAVAASLALTVGLVLRPSSFEPGGETGVTVPTVAHQAPESLKDDEAVATLINLSQRLETGLRQIRSDAPLMPTASVIYQVELEDMVAQVDEELSRNPESTNLWRQRVGLLLDLTRLYRNELRRENARMASL